MEGGGEGLEVPCMYKCHGSKQFISKLKKLFKLYPLAVGSISCPYISIIIHYNIHYPARMRKG